MLSPIIDLVTGILQNINQRIHALLTDGMRLQKTKHYSFSSSKPWLFIWDYLELKRV